MTDRSMGIFQWLLIAVLYFAVLTGPKEPPDPPAAPSAYGAVADFDAPPYPDYDPTPALSYEERFSTDALGDWAWSELAMCRGCPIAKTAVHSQGVGE